MTDRTIKMRPPQPETLNEAIEAMKMIIFQAKQGSVEAEIDRARLTQIRAMAGKGRKPILGIL